MSDGFFSRWSRRKQEVREAEEREAEPTESSPVPTPDEATSSPRTAEGVEVRLDPPDEAAAIAASAEAPLTEEEIAALPPIDSITAETDIRVFLRKGVPEFLRKAALRRSWVLDPMIRDYVDPAREYAYDWNTPGGVPGSGSLLPSDDVDRLLREVLPDSRGGAAASNPPDAAGPAKEAAFQTPGAAGDSSSKPSGEQIGSVRVSQSPSAEQREASGDARPRAEQDDAGETAREAGKASDTSDVHPDDAPQRRRHGSAKPI